MFSLWCLLTQFLRLYVWLGLHGIDCKIFFLVFIYRQWNSYRVCRSRRSDRGVGSCMLRSRQAWAPSALQIPSELLATRSLPSPSPATPTTQLAVLHIWSGTFSFLPHFPCSDLPEICTSRPPLASVPLPQQLPVSSLHLRVCFCLLVCLFASIPHGSETLRYLTFSDCLISLTVLLLI